MPMVFVVVVNSYPKSLKHSMLKSYRAQGEGLNGQRSGTETGTASESSRFVVFS